MPKLNIYFVILLTILGFEAPLGEFERPFAFENSSFLQNVIVLQFPQTKRLELINH